MHLHDLLTIFVSHYTNSKIVYLIRVHIISVFSVIFTLTKELGATIIALSITGLHSGPCRNNDHINVMHCKVLPNLKH